MSDIILVRHGETKWNKEKVFRGRAEIPLNLNGVEQARKTAATLREIPVEAVYSSPLSRAAMTAREIAALHGVEVTVDGAFTDIDFGLWEGVSGAEVARKYPRELRRWMEEPQNGSPPEGETLPQVQTRAWTRLDQIAAGCAGAAVVVTHQVVLKLLLLAALEMPLARFWHLRQDPCAINVLHYRNGVYILGKFNESCHLQDLATALRRDHYGN